MSIEKEKHFIPAVREHRLKFHEEQRNAYSFLIKVKAQRQSNKRK